jgi:hypothetical protein
MPTVRLVFEGIADIFFRPHENPGITERLKHRQLISSPGKIQRFTAESHMPLFTSYFFLTRARSIISEQCTSG